MKYQLVLQFPEELFGDLDWIADIEDRLDESLKEAEVDGHDFGSGEINIFIHTNNPVSTFEVVRTILKYSNLFEYVKVAYREISGDQYTCLWPQNLQDFNIK